jgi:hypothetical protein
MKWRKKPYEVEVSLQSMLRRGLLGSTCNLENMLREWQPADQEAKDLVAKLTGKETSDFAFGEWLEVGGKNRLLVTQRGDEMLWVARQELYDDGDKAKWWTLAEIGLTKEQAKEIGLMLLEWS